MIFEKLKAVLADATEGNGYTIDFDAVTEQSDLYDDLGLDSIVLLMTVIGIEQQFGITLPTEEAKACRTVGDVIALIEKETGR